MRPVMSSVAGTSTIQSAYNSGCSPTNDAPIFILSAASLILDSQTSPSVSRGRSQIVHSPPLWGNHRPFNWSRGVDRAGCPVSCPSQKASFLSQGLQEQVIHCFPAIPCSLWLTPLSPITLRARPAQVHLRSHEVPDLLWLL